MAFLLLKSAVNFSIAIYLTLCLIAFLQPTQCIPVTTTSAEATGRRSSQQPARIKVVKTPSEWLQENKPKSNPLTPDENAIHDKVYAERPHTPRRASVAAKDRPAYDLARQKTHTYGRVGDVISFGIKHGNFDEEKKKEFKVTQGVVNDLKIKHHGKADALLPHH